MKFVNIRHIVKVLDLEMNRIDDSFLQSIKEALQDYFTKNTLLQISGYNFHSEDLYFILDQLKNKKYRVFHEWIEQDAALSNYLLSSGENAIISSSDINILKEHQLFDEYQQFLAPFLGPIFKEQINRLIKNKNFEVLKIHLNFCTLIPQSNRIEIQRPINGFVNQQLKQLMENDELHFENDFDLVFSTQFVQVLNQLDNTFYSTLIAYVDNAKEIVNAKKLNASQLYRIKTTLLHIKLTSKHKEQVVAFCQSDTFQFKNTFLSSIGGWIKSPVFLIGVGVILFLLFIFNWEQHKNQKQEHVKVSAGIDSLSNNELDLVDSLFGYKTDSIEQDEDNIQSSALPDYIITADLNTLKNEKAKALYSNLITDYQIQKDNGFLGNCNPTKKSLFHTPLYSTVQSFPVLSSNHFTINNKSPEELYVLVFQPEKNGKVYGTLIAPGRNLEINLKKEDRIIFYSGQQMNHFNAMRRESNGYGTIDNAKRISKDFDYHFCSQDIYNFQQLNRIYKVTSTKGTIIFSKLSNGGYNVKSDVLELR